MDDPFLQAVSNADDLPRSVQALHGQNGQYAGRCRIERGGGWLIALVLRLGQFPPDGTDVPVRIEISGNGKIWSWRRDFNGHATSSKLVFDGGTGCVRERLGALTLFLKPVPMDGTLSISIHRLSVLGIPCPQFLLPRSSTVEWQDDQGRFRFDVSARMPGLGRLIRYQGWLTPVHINTDQD